MCSKEKLHNAHMLIAKFFHDVGFAFNAAHSIYFQASYSAAAIGRVKKKIDISWNYFQEVVNEEGRVGFIYIFSKKQFNGGGINRMKRHLAGVKGDVSKCLSVPYDVRELILNTLMDFNQNKQEKKKAEEAIVMGFDENNTNVDDVQPRSSKPAASIIESARKGKGVSDYFIARTTPGAQPSIKAAMCSKEKLHNAHMLIYKFFYDAGFAFNAAHSIYFQASYSAAAIDIAALEHVGLLFQKAFKISVFVYNQNLILNWLKARDGWKEIVVKVVVPIIKLLKFVDSDAKPSLAYVYEGMKMIVKGIKDIYNDKESLYKQYVDIVKTMWDKHLKGDLHKAAYYQNLVLVYKHKESAGEVMKTSILNLLEKPAICSDPMQALRELRLYEDAKGSFGRDLAIKGRSQFHP
ncbi:hypothetical protein LINPERHAP2_LOCUS19402, partial [Linum perenne]